MHQQQHVVQKGLEKKQVNSGFLCSISISIMVHNTSISSSGKTNIFVLLFECTALSMIINIVCHPVLLYQEGMEPKIKQLSILCMLMIVLWVSSCSLHAYSIMFALSLCVCLCLCHGEIKFTPQLGEYLDPPVPCFQLVDTTL